jgi:hypothetical protein
MIKVVQNEIRVLCKGIVILNPDQSLKHLLTL